MKWELGRGRSNEPYVTKSFKIFGFQWKQFRILFWFIDRDIIKLFFKYVFGFSKKYRNLTDLLFNGHTVERTYSWTDILFNGPTVQGTYCSKDIQFNRHTIKRTYSWTDKLFNQYTVQPTILSNGHTVQQTVFNRHTVQLLNRMSDDHIVPGKESTLWNHLPLKGLQMHIYKGLSVPVLWLQAVNILFWSDPRRTRYSS